MGTTVVILDMKVKKEAVADLKAGLKEMLPDTRAYDGCQGVDIYEDLDLFSRGEAGRIVINLKE